jgi:hypothetical protein
MSEAAVWTIRAVVYGILTSLIGMLAYINHSV